MPFEIVHSRSGDRRTLYADAKWRGRIEAEWPGAGVMVFDLRTGYGASDTRDWRMTEESARALTGNPEHAFKTPEKTNTGKPKVYGKPRQPSGQLSLLGRMVVEPAAPPSASVTPEAFRQKAHAKLMGAS